MTMASALKYDQMEDSTFKRMVEHDLDNIEKITDGEVHLVYSNTPDSVENRRWHIKCPTTTRVLDNTEIVGFIDGFSEAIGWARSHGFVLPENRCRQDYMAGQICQLEKEHEGDHR